MKASERFDRDLPFIASCPECGVLVWVNANCRLPPCDFREGQRNRVVELVGLVSAMGQGFGVADGRIHICPPCPDGSDGHWIWAVMDDAGERWVEVAAPSYGNPDVEVGAPVLLTV